MTTRLEPTFPQRSAAASRAEARIALPSVLCASDLQGIIAAQRGHTMTWAIREKIGAGFGLALLMMVVISVVSSRSIARLVETAHSVAHSREVLEKLETMRARMTDVDSAA